MTIYDYSAHILCCGPHQIHYVTTLYLLLLLLVKDVARPGDLRLFIFDAPSLFSYPHLVLFGLIRTHLTGLLNLVFALLFGLGKSESVLSFLLLEAVQLSVLRPHLLEFGLLLTLLCFSVQRQLSIGLLSLPEDLLGKEPVGLSSLALGRDPAIHLGLFLLHLAKLVLDVVVFSLRCQVLLLHFELVGKHLVLAPGLRSLVLPPPHAFPLPVQHLLVQRVELFSRLPPVLFLLLLLELLEKFLVSFELKIGDHFVLHARLKLILLLTGDHANLLLDLLVLLLFQILLVGQRCVYGRFDGLDVLESGLPLQLIESDPLL